MIDSNTIKISLNAGQKCLLIDTQQQLSEAALQWSENKVLGLDTEFLRERTYRAELGLVQISDGITAWLVDTVKLQELTPLKQLFDNENILKIFHSASEDLDVIWNTLGTVPRPMIDTQMASAMLGQPLQMSYHNLVKWLTEHEVDKELTRSNWIRRPLKPEQLHYAAMDVVFLPSILEFLHKGLEEAGRWSWLMEDVDRMVDASAQQVDKNAAYIRIKGAARLRGDSLLLLRDLAAWREVQASERNLARNFVVPDTALLKMAIKKPTTKSSLLEVTEMHPRHIQRHESVLMRLIGRERDQQENIESVPTFSRQQRSLIDGMREIVRSQAESLDLDPALLASRKQLESLLLAWESSNAIPERFTGWRDSVITTLLLDWLSKNKASED